MKNVEVHYIKPFFKLIFLCSTVFFCDCTPTFHPGKNKDPQRALIFSDDITNFWRAFDLAENLSEENSLPVYESTYFKKGSVGLREFWSLPDRATRALLRMIIFSLECALIIPCFLLLKNMITSAL